MKPWSRSNTVATILTALLLAGCNQQPAIQDISSVSALAAADTKVLVPTNSDFLLAPGDLLDLTFFYNPDLNQEELIIRPDGKISLPLIPTVSAAGKNPEQLESELDFLYSEQLGQRDITVVVKTLAPRYVFVDGEVGEAGIVELANPMTALQAIAFAKGFEDSGRKDSVLVIRRTVEKNMVVKIDLLSALNGTDASQDLMLQPYDIVFVPKTTIANVNVWMDKYVRLNLPIPLVFGIGGN